jgi:hypothetical protein
MSKDTNYILEKVSLPKLPTSFKILFTGYILSVGFGLLMAGVQIMMTHGMADGKVGLSVDDIVYSYYGNSKGTKLESKLNGSMKANAPDAERIELIKWARNGASKEEWDAKIEPIVKKYCVLCHVPGAPMGDFSTYENVKKHTESDHGASFSSLTRVSHIHLFGIGFIFFFIGAIFTLAEGIGCFWKAVIVLTPFVFLIIDILSWWLTKLSPSFAWLTIIGGLGYSVAAAIMLGVSLWQMWITPFRKKS